MDYTSYLRTMTMTPKKMMNKPRPKQWPAKNTGPLISFLEEEFPDGIFLPELASRTGYSVQNLSSMFRRDNMHLHKAECISRSLGYTLRLQYEYPGEYPKDSEYFPSEKIGNLYGLDEYCQRMLRTYNYLASRANIRGETVKAALQKGDMMLSTLNRLASGVGLRIVWHFEKGGGDD